MNSASSEGKGRMTKIAPNPSPRRLRVCAFGVGRPGVLHTLGQDVAKITPHMAAPAPRTLGPLPQNRVRFPLSCPRPSVRLTPPQSGVSGDCSVPHNHPWGCPALLFGVLASPSPPSVHTNPDVPVLPPQASHVLPSCGDGGRSRGGHKRRRHFPGPGHGDTK